MRPLSSICPFRIRKTCSGIRFSKIKRNRRKRKYEMQKSLEINQKCNEKGHQDTNIRTEYLWGVRREPKGWEKRLACIYLTKASSLEHV